MCSMGLEGITYTADFEINFGSYASSDAGLKSYCWSMDVAAGGHAEGDTLWN